jgi:integrase
MTGMRRGEILGLRWQDVDLQTGRVSVRQQWVKGGGSISYGQPKTAKGRQSIAIDPATVASLREHRRRSADEKLAFGLSFKGRGARVHHGGRLAHRP